MNTTRKDVSHARQPATPWENPARRPNFYAQFLPPEQQEALAEAAGADGLGAEIAFLRVKARVLILEVLARLIRIDARMRYSR